MPAHDYVCLTCNHREELNIPLSQAPPEQAPCSSCQHDAVKAFDAEGTTAIEDAKQNWSDGYDIFQLPENCPDRRVSSRRERDETYKKYGIDPDTHQVISGRENESGAHRWKKTRA